MNSTVITQGIVEQSLQKLLKKTGMGTNIFCVSLGGLLLLIAVGGYYLGFAPDFIGYGQIIIFLLLGSALAGIGVYRIKKRGRLKGDLYSSLIVCGTSKDARAVAEDFNREYESARKDPVLEKAGLFFTKNYVMTRGIDVGIAPHSSVFFVFQQGKAKYSASDDTTFQIYCRYESGLNEHRLPAVRVFGKPGTALLHAIKGRGYPILQYNATKDMKLITLSLDDYQKFESVIRERLGQ